MPNQQQLYTLLDEYEREVNASPLASGSKADYIYFAWVFVRWIDNDFSPGAHVRASATLAKVVSFRKAK